MRFVTILKPFSLFIFCCASGFSLFAQPSVVISNTSHLAYVEKNIYHFQDSAGELSFNMISQLPDTVFTFQPQSDMSFGSTKAVWWFKMYAENKTAQDIYLLFQNHELMAVDCYVIDAVGKIDSMESGRMRPFEKSLFKINTPVFN
ncbi:MAG: 7TMR-DISMED2 domain-containing protein, partial [Ferruginibacter sp.]